MGTGRARRARRQTLHVGRRGSSGSAPLLAALVEWTRTSWPACAERLRALRYFRERSRVVLGLVRRALLSRLASAQSSRSGCRNAAGVARRFMASSDQNHAHCSSQQHPTRVQVQRLRLSLRSESVSSQVGAKYSRLDSLRSCGSNRSSLELTPGHWVHSCRNRCSSDSPSLNQIAAPRAPEIIYNKE